MLGLLPQRLSASLGASFQWRLTRQLLFQTRTLARRCSSLRRFWSSPRSKSTLSAPTVHVVEVPTTLTSDAMSGAWLQWPSNALLIFRGSSPDSFCLGGEPSAARISDGSFVEGVELSAQLHERIERAGMPTIVVCHGATRGEGMLFPCLGSIVLAHSDATFGFPEIRHGALPGVVSVAARRRLGQAACERLFCTGDEVDATTAHQLGLVDFVGSKAQVEAYVASLTERFMALDPARILAIERGPPVHQLPHDVPIRIEVDEHSQVFPPPPSLALASQLSVRSPAHRPASTTPCVPAGGAHH